MKWNLGSARTPIGLDIGAKQIKAAQLTPAGDTWRVEAVSVIPRTETGPLNADQAAQLRSVLQRQGFSGNEVVLAAGKDKLLSGILDLPARVSGAPLDQIARMELSRVHKVPADAFEMSYWQIPSAGRSGAVQVMAVACPHDDANEMIDVLEDAGFDVKAIDAPACALARACRGLLAPGDSATVVLEIGWRSVTLAILYQDVIAFHRSLAEAGLQPLFEATRHTFHLPDEAVEHLLATVGLDRDAQAAEGGGDPLEELAKNVARHFDGLIQELRRSVSYFTSCNSSVELSHLLLAGGGAGIPGLSRHFASEAQLQVQIFTPADVVQCNPPILAKAGNPALATAMGLALFGKV